MTPSAKRIASWNLLSLPFLRSRGCSETRSVPSAQGGSEGAVSGGTSWTTEDEDIAGRTYPVLVSGTCISELLGLI